MKLPQYRYLLLEENDFETNCSNERVASAVAINRLDGDVDEDLIPRTHDTAQALVTEQDDELIKEADEIDELDDILSKPPQKSRNPKDSGGLSENYPSDTFSSE